MLINPIINKENIAAISLLVPFGASLNSFQTKTPQIIATTGAAYEVGKLLERSCGMKIKLLILKD